MKKSFQEQFSTYPCRNWRFQVCDNNLTILKQNKNKTTGEKTNSTEILNTLILSHKVSIYGCKADNTTALSNQTVNVFSMFA